MPTYESKITAYSAQQGEFGSPSTIRATKAIWRIDGASIIPDREVGAMITEGHLPAPNTIWSGSPWTGMTWEKYATFRSMNYRAEQSAVVMFFDLVYDTLYFPNPTTFGQDPPVPVRYELPCGVEYQSKVRSTRIYRQTWTVQPPTTAANTTADIGGSAVGNGHAGISVQVNQVAVRVRLTFDSGDRPMNDLYANNIVIVGSTNSAAFGGFPAYSLICEGFAVAKRTDGFEFYDAVYDMLWDKYAHCEQVPTTGEDGLPVLNNSFQPSEVKWTRIARNGIDYNDIFKVGSPGTVDTVWRDLCLKGWWL